MNTVLTQFIERRKQQVEATSTPFPLASLLQLYVKAKWPSLYIEYFAGFKALVSWLEPIDKRSKYQPQQVFMPLYSYEVQEIAAILNIHPSVIQQELFEIYSSQLGDSHNGQKIT